MITRLQGTFVATLISGLGVTLGLYVTGSHLWTVSAALSAFTAVGAVYSRKQGL